MLKMLTTGLYVVGAMVALVLLAVLLVDWEEGE